MSNVKDGLEEIEARCGARTHKLGALQLQAMHEEGKRKKCGRFIRGGTRVSGQTKCVPSPNQ